MSDNLICHQEKDGKGKMKNSYFIAHVSTSVGRLYYDDTLSILVAKIGFDTAENEPLQVGENL